MRAIERWSLDKHGKALEEIFFLFEGLQQRQNRIRPILPVFIKRENRYAELPFQNYNSAIVESRERFSSHLYDQARERLALPVRLEEYLLTFESNQFDTLWTVHHRELVDGIHYDYEMRISIRGISISHERIQEKEIVRERRINDGYDYALDENGNVIKDENGNDIRSDRYITVRSRVVEFNHVKSVRRDAKVDYLPLQSNELLESYPLTS